MSDERYTVILGDRRYAIHRKWARLPAGRKLRLSVRPDGRRRGSRARRPARHRSAGPGVRPRRQADRGMGRGRAGRAPLHQRRARRFHPGGRPRRPSGAALRCGGPSPAGAGQASLALARRPLQPSDGGGPGAGRRDLCRRRLRQFQRPPLCRRRHAARHLGRPRGRAGHLHDAARHLDRSLRPGAGGRSREQPRPGVRPRRCFPRRMGRLLSSDADLGGRPRHGVRDRPDPAHQPARARTASWSAAAAAPSTAPMGFPATPKAISIWPSCRRRRSPSSND